MLRILKLPIALLVGLLSIASLTIAAPFAEAGVPDTEPNADKPAKPRVIRVETEANFVSLVW